MDLSTVPHSKSQSIVHEATATIRSSTPMAVIHTEQIAIAPTVDSQNYPPTSIKGAKNNVMLGSASSSHPLAMVDNNSLHHFQTDGNCMYTATSMSPFFGSTAGPLSAPSSPSFPNSAPTTVSSTLSFVAMNDHNSHLYEPFRRNSAPMLSDQSHKRIASDEKQLHRQASWSSFTSTPNLHQLDGPLDERSPYSMPFHMQQHALHQAMPSSNSSTCDSPMPEHFMGSEMDTDMGNGGVKIKRNNSVCSTTSVSSSGSLSGNNKHPCKFPNCGWTFKRYEHLKRHRLVHTKERTFVCDASGCNKTFSRSDNFSAHVKTHSKKGSSRRDDSQGPDDSSCDTDMSIKQEGDICMGSDNPAVSSPPTTLASQRSSPGDIKSEDTKSLPSSEGAMMGNNFSFGISSMYPLDHMDQLGNMVPRFDHIRLELKSVAPSDIHKSNMGGNPNGESPYPSPMPHYEQFAFPSSISTHFMPTMMQPGFPMDHNLQMGSSSLESPASSSYTPSLPSADSTTSSMSAEQFQGTGFYPDHDMRFSMGPTIPSMGGDMSYHYPGTLSEGAHHLHFQQHDLDPQMLQRPQHHSIQTFPTSGPAAPMQSHLLTPNSPSIPFSNAPTPGLNEPLYSNPSQGARGKCLAIFCNVQH